MDFFLSTHIKLPGFGAISQLIIPRFFRAVILLTTLSVGDISVSFICECPQGHGYKNRPMSSNKNGWSSPRGGSPSRRTTGGVEPVYEGEVRGFALRPGPSRWTIGEDVLFDMNVRVCGPIRPKIGA